jgi:hypothetical protein
MSVDYLLDRIVMFLQSGYRSNLHGAFKDSTQ